ncbi:hypothetical protein BH18ACT6_BH18ACT6_22950 [soil metagenome]
MLAPIYRLSNHPGSAGTIYIREPNDRSDVGNGNGNGLGQIVADVIWFGPNATCDGAPVDFYGGATVSGGFKLVAS